MDLLKNLNCGNTALVNTNLHRPLTSSGRIDLLLVWRKLIVLNNLKNWPFISTTKNWYIWSYTVIRYKLKPFFTEPDLRSVAMIKFHPVLPVYIILLNKWYENFVLRSSMHGLEPFVSWYWKHWKNINSGDKNTLWAKLDQTARGSDLPLASFWQKIVYSIQIWEGWYYDTWRMAISMTMKKTSRFSRRHARANRKELMAGQGCLHCTWTKKQLVYSLITREAMLKSSPFSHTPRAGCSSISSRNKCGNHVIYQEIISATEVLQWAKIVWSVRNLSLD